MGDRVVLTGWGRTPQSSAQVVRPTSPKGVHISDHGRGQLARGLGRSYGDAALNAGGLVWDTTALTTLEIDKERAIARAGAGVSYFQLLTAGVPSGLFPSVTPGTKFVTLGGAVAADVHGKNHHRDGSIGDHIECLTMLTGSGEIVETRPGDELFEATVGGMGLTGFVLEVSLRMIRIDSPELVVDTIRTVDLAGTLEIMSADDHKHRYSVAWVDLIHPKHPGRGVITFGDHAASGDLSQWKPPHPLATVPAGFPSGLINRASVRVFNELRYQVSPQNRSGQLQPIEQFFYPLDIADRWNRLYGRSGFVQYQMVVPFGHEDVLEETLAAIQCGPAPPALGVLKRLGKGRGLLSFPIPGWTLAVDFPASSPDLAKVLDRIDEWVAGAGGRVYLAKDSRLHASLLPAMYQELERWRELADKADPQQHFRSDLDRRLGLRRG